MYNNRRPVHPSEVFGIIRRLLAEPKESLMEFQMPLREGKVIPHCQVGRFTTRLSSTWGPTLPGVSWTFPHFWAHIFFDHSTSSLRTFYGKSDEGSHRGPADHFHSKAESLTQKLTSCHWPSAELLSVRKHKPPLWTPHAGCWLLLTAWSCQQFSHTRLNFIMWKVRGLEELIFHSPFTTDILWIKIHSLTQCFSEEWW